MIYLDANTIIAACSNQGERTDAMHRLLQQAAGPFYVSPLAEYEARKMLYQLPDIRWLELMEDLTAHKFEKLAGGWDSAIVQALKIARQFKSRLVVDSADTLHVGWALSIGADTFASFDRESGPRALALCQGLKLWPKPEPKDFKAMARLKPMK